MSNLYAIFNTPVRFDGDIIITDPCYIIRDRNSEQLIDTLNIERVAYPKTLSVLLLLMLLSFLKKGIKVVPK